MLCFAQPTKTECFRTSLFRWAVFEQSAMTNISESLLQKRVRFCLESALVTNEKLGLIQRIWRGDTESSYETLLDCMTYSIYQRKNGFKCFWFLMLFQMSLVSISHLFWSIIKHYGPRNFLMLNIQRSIHQPLKRLRYDPFIPSFKFNYF